MSNFLNNLEGAAKARMISNMKSALEATQEKMNQNQQAKFRSGVLKAAITTGKLAMAGVGAGMAVMALSNGAEAVLTAAEHSMAYGSEAMQAAEASKSAISAAMGYGLVSATLAAGVALVHKHFKCMEGQISEFKQDHPLKILQTALTETGCDALLNSPEDYTDKQVQDAVGACVQYLSEDPEILEFALAWGNTLNTKQDNKNKMRFS